MKTNKLRWHLKTFHSKDDNRQFFQLQSYENQYLFLQEVFCLNDKSFFQGCSFESRMQRGAHHWRRAYLPAAVEMVKIILGDQFGKHLPSIPLSYCPSNWWKIWRYTATNFIKTVIKFLAFQLDDEATDSNKDWLAFNCVCSILRWNVSYCFAI